MLVLTRKSGQKIIIRENGKEIVISVLKVQGEQISVGIKAPRSTTIYREEVLIDIQRANEGGAIKKDSPEAVNIRSVAQNLKQKFGNNAKNQENRSRFNILKKKQTNTNK